MNRLHQPPTAYIQVGGAPARLLDTTEVCTRLGICRPTWFRWLRKGYAPQPAALAGPMRWRVVDIDRFERGRPHQGTESRGNQR